MQRNFASDSCKLRANEFVSEIIQKTVCCACSVSLESRVSWRQTQVRTAHISSGCERGTRVAGGYQSGCAGARWERHGGGRRSYTWGTWRVSLRSAVWCGEVGFPSAWRRPRTGSSEMASRLAGRRKHNEIRQSLKGIRGSLFSLLCLDLRHSLQDMNVKEILEFFYVGK